jgi:glycosyltransferase involved in cell wall biosynthesis
LNKLRVLIAPRPGKSNGPAVSLLRLNHALNEMSVSTTALMFRLTGIVSKDIDFSIVMGIPKHAENLYKSEKPSILILGKPEDPQECMATGRIYTSQDEKHAQDFMLAIKKSNHVAFISNYVREIWKKRYLTAGIEFPEETKQEVIYHGLDLRSFNNSIRNKNLNIFTIGCVGAIRTKMRVDAIYKVSKHLPFRHKFLIVGSITEECSKYLREIKNRSDFYAEIEEIKWIPQEKLPLVYARMSCLLHPVDYEGFGIVISEALACGIPVIAPEHGAAVEVIGSGGVLARTEQFKYSDDFFESLAEGILTVKLNIDLYSHAARSQAVDKFDIFKIANRFLEIGKAIGMK